MVFWDLAIEFLADLHEQHVEDMLFYRKSHRERSNLWLHRILIPAETFSFILLASMFLLETCGHYITSRLVRATAFGFGAISLLLSESYQLGISVLLVHIIFAEVSLQMIQNNWERRETLQFGLLLWVLSWFFQIFVGHYILERNQPNLLDESTPVSFLATTQSILMAWK